jgi:hypothetical protein
MKIAIWVFTGILLSKGLADESKIGNNLASSLVTGSLVGATLFTFANSDIVFGDRKADGQTVLAALGSELVCIAPYLLTRNALSPNGERRLYNASYAYLGAVSAGLIAAGLSLRYLDKESGEGLYFPVFAITTGTLAGMVGGVFGYKYGHKLMQTL